eukprot:TCALIF_00385-PA protein Name:"Similar to Ovol2 Transcription factor Ovo-like 2 (Mus musculus)" AED:0.66 eAED:0.66 QI:0/0/0/0.33/1/1/3/0/499
MNIHRNSKVEEILDEYHNLQNSELFTDLDFITKNGGRKSVHSLVLAASSDFLKQWMENSFPSPWNRFTIILPEIDCVELDIIISILYGVDSAVPEELVPKINQLADMLGISVDLPFRVVRSSTLRDGGEIELVDPNEVINPICCWHCNKAVDDFEHLKVHLMSHAGAQLAKKKVHRCLECNKVYPNIWKLRQHYREHALRRKLAKETSKVPDPIDNISEQVLASVQMPPPPPPPLPSVAVRNKRNPNEFSLPDHTRPKRKLNAVRDDHSYDFRRAKTVPKIPDDRSDHQYSTRSLKKLPIKFHEPKEPKVSKTSEDDPLQSGAQANSTSKNDSSNASKPLFSQGDDVTKIAPTKRSSSPLEIRKSRQKTPSKASQSIQAMGHSYAAARPRRISGSLTGGKGPLTSQMYPCDQCNKTFPQPYRLNRHIKEVHIKEKRHFCQFCDKAFFKTTSKDRHELTHSDHQLWRCDVCDKNFRDQSSLKYHVNHNVCMKKDRDVEGL